MSVLRQAKAFFHEHERVGALLFFISVVAVAYAPVVVGGKSLQSPVSHPDTVLPQGAYGYEGRTPFSAFSVDASGATFSEHPLNKIVGDIYRSGALPLWNPYKGVGEPLPEQLGSSAFFPYQVLEDISPWWLWDFFLLGRLVVAGFFSFLFLRALNFSRLGSLLGGMVYMLSGSMVWFINNEALVNPAMMLPVLLWGVELVMQKADGRSVAALAASTGLLLLAGPPMVSIYGFFLAGAFFLFRVISRQEDDELRSRAVRGFFLGMLLGLGLAAPLLVPFFDFLGQVNVLRAGTGSSWVHPLHFLFTIFPALSYVPAEYRFITNGLWDNAGSYVGILPMFLIGLGAACFIRIKQGRRMFWFFVAFGGLILLKNYGVFPATLLGKLPLLGTIWSPRWAAPVWTFSLMVAAVAGFDMLRIHAVRANTAIMGYAMVRPKLFWGLAGVGGAGILAALGFSQYRLLYFLGALPHILAGAEGYSWAGVVFYGVAVLAILIFVLGIIARSDTIKHAFPLLIGLSLIELWLSIPRGYASSALLIVPTLLALSAVAFLIRRKVLRAALCIGLCIGSYVAVDYASPFGLPGRFDPYTVPPYVQYLQGQPGNYRSIGTYGILMPNIAGAFGLQDFRHVSGVIPKDVYSFKKNLLQTREHPFWFLDKPEPVQVADVDVFSLYCGPAARAPMEHKRDFSERVPYYSLLGIKYFLVPPGGAMDDFYDIGERDTPFPLVYDGEVRIYENPDVLPRAFIAHAASRVDSYESAHRELAKMGRAALGTTVVIESDVPEHLAPARGPEEAVITSYEPNRVTVQASASASGILVLTDSFYPGWSATIDGTPAQVLRVDGIFRGVLLPPGRHEVILSYRPVHFAPGVALAAVSIIALGFLFFASRHAWPFPYLMLGVGILGCGIVFFYGQGIVMYARHWSDIHADVWELPDRRGVSSAVQDDRQQEARFISEHIESLTSNFEGKITRVEAFWFPRGRFDQLAVDYRNGAGQKKRVVIRIIPQGQTETIQDIHLKGVTQYVFDDYLRRGKLGVAPSGSIPSSLAGEARRSGILDLLLFYWLRDKETLDSKLYITHAEYVRKGNAWIFEAGSREPDPSLFTDGLSYDCKEATWKNL